MNAVRIFGELHGALKTWWQGHAQINHALMPATILQGVQLWHARQAGPPPNQTEFFSFDVDHSWAYASMAFQDHPTTLWRYVTKRPLKAVYLDGQSGAKTEFGSRYVQQMLFFGEIRDLPGSKTPVNDLALADGLCEWAKTLRVDAFVRQESLFEVILCNFGDTLHLVEGKNMTAHYSPPRERGQGCARDEVRRSDVARLR